MSAAKGRGGLGRGLGSLIPSFAAGTETVEVDRILSNPQQPRSSLDAEALAELAESIRRHGVLQPLLVTRVPSPDGRGSAYQLIAGERRLQAARQAGLARVPVIVREAAEGEALELALVENLQRADLSPLEEAGAYRRLVDEFSLTQEEVARRVGRSRAAVANSLRLLSLDPEMKASLARREISEGHARALLAVADEGQRRRLWQLAVQRGLSVRQLEALARQAKAGAVQPRRHSEDAQMAALVEQLQSALGTRVSLVKGHRGGRLTIHFYSDEELEGIVGRLLGS